MGSNQDDRGTSEDEYCPKTGRKTGCSPSDIGQKSGRPNAGAWIEPRPSTRELDTAEKQNEELSPR